MTSLDVDGVGDLYAKRRRFVGIAREGSGFAGDHVLSANPNEKHHAALRRMWWWWGAVVLALRNQLQSLSVFLLTSASCSLARTLTNLSLSRLAAERFATHLSCSRCDEYFFYFNFIFFADFRRLLLVCYFSTSGAFRNLSGGGGVMLFLLVSVFR